MKPAPIRVQLPALKKWAKSKLEPFDWNFSPLCDDLERALGAIGADAGAFLVMRAFTWEIERELGSGNGAFDLASELANQPRPVDDSRECELVIMRHLHRTVSIRLDEGDLPLLVSVPRRNGLPLFEWSLADLVSLLPSDVRSVSRGSADLCVLEIPWTDDDEDVVEAFRLWLRSRRGGTARTSKPGRKHNWRTWFLNLAAYRLSAASYTRNEINLKLDELRADRLYPFDPQHFCRAKQFIREQIDWRFQTMQSATRQMNQQFPDKGYADWKNHFLKARR